MVFDQTPLMSWWKNGVINKQKDKEYKVSHFSGALRLALIWKYGGVYSDTDMIALKSFSDLRKLNGFGDKDGSVPS